MPVPYSYVKPPQNHEKFLKRGFINHEITFYNDNANKKEKKSKKTVKITKINLFAVATLT